MGTASNLAWMWLAILLGLGLLELVTVQLVSIWFVVGAAGALVAALCGLGLGWQIAIFLALSLLLLALTRPLLVKKLTPRTQALNADRIVGAHGVVTEAIDNTDGHGLIRVEGMTWTARTESGLPLEEGRDVTVIRIEGVKAIVAPSDPTEN